MRRGGREGEEWRGGQWVGREREGVTGGFNRNKEKGGGVGGDGGVLESGDQNALLSAIRF